LSGAWRMRSLFCMGVAVGLWGSFGWGPPVCVAADEPLRIEKGVAQLFVDDFLIESQRDLKRTLRQPVKDNNGTRPLITPGPGAALLAWGSIVYDPRLEKYVMFLLYRDGRGHEVRQATSSDGLDWDQNHADQLIPVTFDMGLEPEPGFGSRTGFDLFTCYYDRKDAEYPYQGWLFYANYGPEREGVYFVRSRNGRRWERVRQICSAFAGPGDTSCRTITQDGKTVSGPGDVTLFSYDARTNRFLGIFKFFRLTGKDKLANGYRSRAYLWLDRIDEPVDVNRIDRIALLPPGAQRDGDTPFDEYYASTAWRYESVWLGGLKVHHARGDYPYSAAGCSFLKLVVSRDGLHWKKVPFENDAGVREVFIPNGPEGGNSAHNDGGYLCEFSQGPLRIGDELIYYYSASSYGKNHPKGVRITGGGVFRARLRVDGFVSVDWGTLTTRPLVFEGEDLLVNAVGPVTVDVLSVDGAVLGSAAIAGDSIRHEVDFDGRSLSRLAGSHPIRLRFIVPPEGRLYSFTVR